MIMPLSHYKSCRIYYYCLVAILAAMVMASPSFAAHKEKLKPGVKSKECLKCHVELQKTFSSRSVHPMTKDAECLGCHDPHTSYQKSLLVAEPKKLCLNCHAKIIPDKASSVHQVVVEGNCGRCHYSHGSENRSLLKKSGNDLCLECHQEIIKAGSEMKFPHQPVKTKEGCLNCHTPHASAKADYLLKNDPSKLCIACHKTDKPGFAKKHMNYNVAASKCEACHSPHGSNRRGILYDHVHPPVAENKCSSCHYEPSSSMALKTRQTGTELCLQCHKKMVAEAMGKNQVHWPMLDKTGCQHCHTPHGSKAAGLLSGPQPKVCGQCHIDTVELQKWSIANPKNEHLCEPVKKGKCSSCHLPHAANGDLLFASENVSVDICGKCHKWESHSTHPIGAKAIDQRNKNLTVECLSCHKGCGTSNKPYMMPFDTTYDLCVQCHIDRKR